MKSRLLISALFFAITSASGTAMAELKTEVVRASEVKWTPLNPARGDASPKAGTLWGDRAGRGATGFLVRFNRGFSSPPHIHNVTYRGVVIRGLVHNDDPKAAETWMPAGSFWTQPAGEVHITSAKDEYNIAYIEIGDGPYLVRPAGQAFDNGERPVNVDVSNLVWVDLPGSPANDETAKIAYLWGQPKDKQLNGTMIKLPKRFIGELRTAEEGFRAVVIKGQTGLQIEGNKAAAAKLEPGSYFGSQGRAVHRVSCGAGSECVLYVRATGKYTIASP